MRTVRVHGISLVGTEADPVTVEARFEPEDHRRTEVVLSGLPDPVIRESRARLLSALEENSLRLPQGRLFLNLAPAGRRKSGGALDLPLALGAAAASGHVLGRQLAGTLFLGELGIDGRLQAVPGGLAAAELALRLGLRRLVAPGATADEAAWRPGLEVWKAADLARVVRWVACGEGLERLEAPELGSADSGPGEGARVALDSIRGQATVKRALCVAAAGGHGLLLLGPPGSGKTQLARGLIGLLPSPSLEECLELTRVASVTGCWPGTLVRQRPFRAPHHTASYAGLVGGGSPLVPGEITLAHQGVLFLDELPEFRREALEALREPLENGRIHLARAGRRLELPAAFLLVAAMNPCPCGYRGHPSRPCRCSPHDVARYRRRISGPLLDRIELRVEIPTPTPAELARPERAAERCDALRRRVLAARKLALERRPAGAQRAGRFDAHTGARTRNADELDRAAALRGAARRILERAMERRGLSARAAMAVRSVARTLADLEGARHVGERHVAEALALRAPSSV